MKRLSVFLLSSLIFSNVHISSFSQEEPPIHLGFSYIGDHVNNFMGGIKKGYGYLNMISLTLSADSKTAGLWNGGNLFIRGSKTHGATPSQSLIGDLQVSSNIEAGNHTYLQELWYSQSLGNFKFIAGLQDMNVEFANTKNGAIFLNSSFGIHPTISANFPAPVFPLTSLGFTAEFSVSDKLIMKAAVYAGSPISFEDNPYNLRWKMNLKKESLFVSEAEYRTRFANELSGTYKAGYIQHMQAELAPDSTNRNKTLCNGIYMAVDQQVWQKTNGGLSLFGQLSFNPGNRNKCFYSGFGVNYTGVFSKKGNDVTGIAFAHVVYPQSPVHETSIEMTYQVTVLRNFFIQPDLQYIINPSGRDIQARDCLAGTLRIGVNL